MNDSHKREIFRLAAVLYADNNYEVKPKTIHRKIIESIFLDNDNCQITTHTIVELIEKEYSFVFDFEEVIEIVKEDEGTHFLIGKDSSNELLISLTPKRRQVLNSKLKNKNIDYFIHQFADVHKELIGSLDGKSIIYKFLYEIFSNNISSFSKLIDFRKELNGAINIDESFNAVEKTIINAFLQWDNDDKNKAVFDISSYALEYCMITNKGTKQAFHLNSLKNKFFYLDTNVLFRAIGINGENRRARTTTFLDKFIEAGEKLFISKFTEQEYKSTIKYYSDQISRKSYFKVDPRVFSRFRQNSDFYDFYHQWRIGRANDSIKLFEAHLLAEYESLKVRFKVEEDYDVGFNEREDEVLKQISNLSEDIFSFKSQENSYFIRFETTETDAKNILLINEKRKGQFRNIFETKYFFISSDQGLRRWDFARKDATPVVLLPSQWMSILLRYINRTNDDFKSFVSFLNLSQNESHITSDNLQLILLGIADITKDVERQSLIVSAMIETKFKGIIAKAYSEENIIENARIFAKTQLDIHLDSALKNQQILELDLEKEKNKRKTAIEQENDKQTQQMSKTLQLEKENSKLKATILYSYVSRRMITWKVVGYLALLLALTAVGFYVLLFCYHHESWNLPTRLAKWIDSLPEDSTIRQVAYSVYILPAATLPYLFRFVYNRIFDTSKTLQKRTELKTKGKETFENL